MLIDAATGTEYCELTGSVVDWVVKMAHKFAIVDELPIKVVEVIAETDNDGTPGETLTTNEFDTTQITDEQFRAGYLKLKDVAPDAAALLEIYKDCEFYAGEKRENEIAEIRKNQQTAKYANFTYNGDEYYADADGREAIQGTLLIATAKVLTQLAEYNETLKAALNTPDALQYMTAEGKAVSFSYADFVNFASAFFAEQQKITFKANAEIAELSNDDAE